MGLSLVGNRATTVGRSSKYRLRESANGRRSFGWVGYLWGQDWLCQLCLVDWGVRELVRLAEDRLALGSWWKA